MILFNNLKAKKFLPYFLICSFLVLVALFLFLGEHQRLMFNDGISPSLSAQFHLENFSASWSSIRFGSPSSFHPFDLFIYLVFSLTGNAVITQQVIAVIPFLLGSLFMFYFLNNTDIISSKLVKFFISLFYGFNTFFIKSLGGATSLNFTYAFLPLIVFYSIRLCFCKKNQRIVNTIKLALSLTLATILNSQALFLAVLLVAPFLMFIFIFNPNKLFTNGKDRLRVLFYFSLFLLLYFLLTIEISFPYINLLISGGVEGVFQGVRGVSSGIMVNSGWYKSTYPLIISPFLLNSYGLSNNWLALNCLIAVFTIFSFGLADKKRRFYFLVNLIIILVYSFIINLIIVNNNLANLIYSKFFIFRLFVEPAKWAYLLIIPVCLLIGLSLDTFLIKLKNHLLVKRLGFIFLLAILFSSSFYSLYNKKISFNAELICGQGGNHVVPFREPVYADEIRQDINSARQREGIFRVLWLPSDGASNYFKGKDFYSYIFPSSYPQINNYFINTFDGLEKNGSFNIRKTLRIFNIKYIVVLKKIKHPQSPGIWYYQGIPQFIIGNPESFISYLNLQKGIDVYKNTEDYIIYRVL